MRALRFLNLYLRLSFLKFSIRFLGAVDLFQIDDPSHLCLFSSPYQDLLSSLFSFFQVLVHIFSFHCAPIKQRNVPTSDTGNTTQIPVLNNINLAVCFCFVIDRCDTWDNYTTRRYRQGVSRKRWRTVIFIRFIPFYRKSS
jgi:hypothetical protein